MAIVSDDQRAVDASDVACAWKVTDENSGVYWLVVTCKGTSSQVTSRFEKSDQRDEFYKRLVDAMSQ